MKKFTSLICRGLLLIPLFCFNVPSGFSQVVYLNHFQTAYDLGCQEINYTLIQENNRNYFYVPSSNCDTADPDSYSLRLLETDEDFNPLWSGDIILYSPYEDTLSSMIAFDLIQSNDSSLYACGTVTYRDYPYQQQGFILKLTATGTPDWLKFYSPVEEFRSIIQISDSNFALCGKLYQSSDTTRVGVILKINNQGTVSWARKYWEGQGSWHPTSSFNQIISNSDTLYAIGTTNEGTYQGAQADVMLAKLRSNGTAISQMAYTRASDPPLTSTVEYGKTLKYKSSRLWLAGDIKPLDTLTGSWDYYVMEVNRNNLMPIWTKRYDISQTGANLTKEYVQRFLDESGSLTLTGYVHNNTFGPPASDNAFLVNMDNSGNSPSYNIFGDNGTDRFYKTIRNADGNIVAAGYSDSFNSDADVYVVEKFSNVEERCHDTLRAKDPLKLKFDTNLVHTNTVSVTTESVKLVVNEGKVHQDSICPKIIVDTLEGKVIPVREYQSGTTLLAGPSGQLVLPEDTREYELYNMSGSMVLQGKTQGSLLLNVSVLRPGVYVLNLISNSSTRKAFKLIK